jgi:hypothetical protein
MLVLLENPLFLEINEEAFNCFQQLGNPSHRDCGCYRSHGQDKSKPADRDRVREDQSQLD